MRSIGLLMITTAIFVVTGRALAKDATIKEISTVVANDHPQVHQHVRALHGHIEAMSNDQRSSPSEPTYLNLSTHNAPLASHVSLEGGEPTPYGFPAPNYPDDEIGFYKSGYEAYENSPLDGYYSWSGHTSP